ncbi:KamA family radical SAM protein [bacterium]|nr:KamA family radical SAM protein [bacterium]
MREAREQITAYVSDRIRFINREGQRLQPLEWHLQNQSLQALRKLLSLRSERVVKYSLLNLLWQLAHGMEDTYPEDLSDGFFEEMIHLFKGLRGKSGIYSEESYPEFADLTGRDASIVRSAKLDKMADKLLFRMDQYPTGMDEEIVLIRDKNKRRILKYFGASEEDWTDSQWHLDHVITNADVLGSIITLKTEEKEAIKKASKVKIPFGITPYYASLMDQAPHRRRDHAVRAQVIPPMSYVDAMAKNKDQSSTSLDFMLESDTSPIELITRRYPMIVILKPFNTCSQICVYCQRNWEIDDVLCAEAMASREKLDAAIKWITKHPAIREVLVTGGDPLVMRNEDIDYILDRLSRVRHVERIRIGSRTPVVLPQRITDDLMEIIKRYHKPGRRGISLITHFEHPYEVTPESMEAVQKFKRCGISVYNQAVFTVENSRRSEMVALRRVLRLIGVEPYYTFNTKGKEETKAYRVPLARLRQEIKEEARLTPGLMRTDEPVYNVPGLGKNYLRALQHHSLLTVLPDGRRVYEFHPWEKHLSMANTFVDIDVSIYDYLKELKRRGENIEDYRTIWYYY